jgi:hypothetical protein
MTGFNIQWPHARFEDCLWRAKRPFTREQHLVTDEK